MSYQVIARKYRPQRFADVVGQEHVTTTLANAIASGRIAHAYLFCGPRGTGKTTLARIFAKCLNCTGGPKADFPEDDPRAQEIAEGRALDVLEIDGASNNGVEQVRELRETARFAPANSKFKIYIIDEVHMLSAAAFNALLKTLEEPPAHVKFLFATTDPEKVLPTILSRCQRFDLRRIPSALIVAQLSRIAAAEGVEAEPAALDAIARGADGGMRDAQSTLDQLISFCGKRLVEADVLSMFGLAGRAQLRAIASAILDADKAAVLREFDGLARGGKDLGRLLGDLLSHFRNLLLWVVSKGDRSLIEASEADIEAIASQAADIDADTMTRILDVLSAAEGRLRDAASKRIFLEVALLKAVHARNAVGIDAVLRQLKALREGLPLAPAQPGGPTASAVPAAPVVPAPPARPAAPQPAPAASSSPTAGPAGSPTSASSPPRSAAPSSSNRSLDNVWQALLGALLPDDGLLQATLAHCSPVSLERGTLRIRHPEGDMLDTPRTLATLKARLLAATGEALDVAFEAGPVEPPPRSAPEVVPVAPLHAAPSAAMTESASKKPMATEPPAAPAPAKPRVQAPPPSSASGAPVLLSKEEFLNDPAIRMALDIFKGQIVEVRAPGA